MKQYTCTLNKREGDFLIHEFGSFNGKVRAINADHAARLVALQFHERCESIGQFILASHKSGERASVEIGTV